MQTSTAHSTMRRHTLVLSALMLMGLSMLLTLPQASWAQSPAPVDLGSAEQFGALAGSTVTSTGNTNVVGDIGLNPGSAVDGFPPGTLTGSIFINTPEAVNGQANLTTAYNDAAGRSTNPIAVAGNIGGLTLPPGLYKAQTSLDISSGDLTLDAQGDQDAVWIFQIGSTLTTTSGRQVILSNGAQASNVFWQVGTSATIGTSSIFMGTILADQSITLETGATLTGRALARIGAVTLDGNIVTVPVPAAPPPPVEQVTLNLPDDVAETNSPIELAVTTTDIDGKGALSYDFTVEYDPAVLTIDNVGTAGTLSENATVTFNATPGSIQVSGAQATDFAGSGILINLTGTAIGAGNSTLSFTNVSFNAGDPEGVGVDGSLQVNAPPPVEIVTLTLPTESAETNSPIALAVATVDMDGKGVLSYDFTVEYDPAVLTIDNVGTAGTLSENATVTFNATPGSIQVSGAQATDFAGSGILINLTGTAIGAGNSNLSFTNVTFNAGNPEGAGVDGSIQVNDPPPVEIVTLTLPDDVSGTNTPIQIPVTTTDIDGKGVRSFDFTVTYDPAILTLDNVDTAGTLSEDATFTVDATSGRIHVTGIQASDVTGGGILINLTGTSAAVGTSDLTFTNVTFNAGSPQGNGVDGSFQVVADLPSEAVTLTVRHDAAGTNMPIEIPVTTIDIDGKGVLSYDFTIIYDANVLTLDGVETNNTLSEEAVITLDATLGRIHVTGIQASDITGGGVLLYLTGMSKNVGTSVLTFTNVDFNSGAPLGTGIDGSLQVVADLPGEVVTLTVPENAAGTNMPVVIPVTTIDIDGKGVLSYDFTLVYDANVLTLDGFETDNTLSEEAVITLDATSGRIHITGIQASDVTGGGALIYLTGTSKSPGMSSLTFTNVDFNTGAPVGRGIDGSLQVVADLPSEVVSLTLPDDAAGTNMPVQLAVTTIDIDGKGVLSYDFTVVYDASVLTLDGVETNNTLSEEAVITLDATLGRLHVTGIQASNVSGGGVLIYLTGTSKEVGTSSLTFTNVTFNDGAPIGLGVDGDFQVVGDLPGEVVTLTLPNDAAGTNMPIDLAVTTIDMDGKGVLSYDFTVVYDASVLTLDGVETAGTISRNAVITLDATLGRIHVTGIQATDFSGGGVLIYLTGTSSNVGNSNLTFTNVTFNEGAPVGRGVNGSLQVVGNVPGEVVTLSLPNTDTVADTPISLPVLTRDIHGKNVVSFDFTVVYDANVLTLDDAETIGSLSQDAVITVDATLGRIRVTGVQATDVSGSGALIFLTGTSRNVGESNLTFTNVTFNEGAPVGDGVDGHLGVVASVPAEFVTLVLPDTQADENVAISIPMSTSNIQGKNVLSYYVTVTYDPSVLTLDGFETAGTLSEGAAVTVNTTDGAIHLVGSRTSAFTGSGVLINLTGTTSSAGNSDLSFASVFFNDGEPSGFGVDGSIQVGPIAPIEVVTLTLPDASAEINTPVSLAVTTLDMEGKGVMSYDFTVLYDASVLTLDTIDTNGTLSEDATMTVNATAGSIHVTGARLTDFTGSGVLLYLTGTSGAVGQSDLTFSDVTFNGGTPVAVTNDGSMQVIFTPPPQEVTLTLPITGTEPSVAIALPVLTRDVEGKDVIAYDFTVAYDPTIITLDGVETTGTLSEDATVTFNSTEGTIRVVGRRTHTFSESGVLVYLTGTSSTSGTSDLTFTNVSINEGVIIGHGVDGNILITVGVANEESANLPVAFALKGNYPNPFNPSTTISIDLPETADVSVGIFDMLGRQVMTVPATSMQAGSNRGLRIDASSLTTGMYLYRVMATSASETQILTGRMSLMK